jgi:hypothetical protein
MARSSHKLFTCDGGAALSGQRGKLSMREYDIAFKLTGQPLSSREGEIVLLFIPRRKSKLTDGAKTPAKRGKAPRR